jgi:hypothetical protein
MISKVLIMFGLAFAISMFVALIIKLIYIAITSKTLGKYYDAEMMEEYKRAKRIKKLRLMRLVKEMQELNKIESNEIVDHYYGSNKNS